MRKIIKYSLIVITILIVGLIIGFVAAITSTLIAARVFGEITFNTAYILIEEPADKIISALIAFILTQILPKKIYTLLPRPENVERGHEIAR